MLTIQVESSWGCDILESIIEMKAFSKLAVVSQTFHDQTGGMSLTGWQYEDLKQIWTRAYDQLTKFDYDSVALRHVIRQARANMRRGMKAEVEPSRGRSVFGTQHIGCGVRLCRQRTSHSG